MNANPKSTNANDIKTSPEYTALADLCREMVDAFCAGSDRRQRLAANKAVDLLGDREIPLDEILDTLVIRKNGNRASGGGRWVSGTIARHAFEALVFEEHAEVESYELDQSRISKLWLKDQLTGEVVANFDRGWDTKPATTTAQRITDLLADGLAEHVFGG